MKKLSILLFVLLIQIFANGQIENIPLITVKSTVTEKVLPDHVVIGVKIEKEVSSKTADKILGFEIFQDQDVRINLFDFDNKDITKSLTQVKGNYYVKECFITVNDLSKLERYLVQLQQQNFTQFTFIEYRSHKLETQLEKAQQRAIQRAKEKAKIIVNASGVELGKPHLIKELNTNYANWYQVNQGKELSSLLSQIKDGGYQTEPGYIIISTTFEVSFDLVKK